MISGWPMPYISEEESHDTLQSLNMPDRNIARWNGTEKPPGWDQPTEARLPRASL